MDASPQDLWTLAASSVDVWPLDLHGAFVDELCDSSIQTPVMGGGTFGAQPALPDMEVEGVVIGRSARRVARTPGVEAMLGTHAGRRRRYRRGLPARGRSSSIDDGADHRAPWVRDGFSLDALRDES